MDEEELNETLRKAIADRLFGWELVEFLDIDIEEIIDLFEEQILENIDDVKELINFGGTDTEDND